MPSTPQQAHAHAHPRPSSAAQITDETLSTIRQILVSAYRIGRFRARQQLTVFALCLTADILLILVSIWQPLRAANPAFVLCAAVLTWLGTTMLYSGFIYGRWEANALMTVIEELELLSRYPPLDDGGHGGGVLGQGARYAGT
jgi:sphingomyelin phosphodiesterase 2